ncbi:MAG: glycosyltransferase family A protein [Gilvibacter sp.]
MKFCIIMPVYNEEAHLKQVLDSYTRQQLQPDQLIIIDDNSTDQSLALATQYCQNNSFAKLYSFGSSDQRLPGPKVIAAFNFGLSKINLEDFDFIGKFDADILLPENYFEFLIPQFKQNPKLGIASGILHVLKNDAWEYESISKKSKVRGPVKLYRKACFNQIDGLSASMGWDTADVFLAQFYGWETQTFTQLIAKHLRPTGHGYRSQDAKKQGETFYFIGYSFPIAALAAFKLALKKRNLWFAFKSLKSYAAKRAKSEARIVSNEQAKFINKKRWQDMF